jgi:hypothetical protein
MMTMLLIAGFAVLAVGLLAIALGIPVKEFSFGNTLILTGAIAACTGVILLGLSVVVRELQNIARRLGPANAPARADAESGRASDQPAFPPQAGAKPPPSAGPSVSRQEDGTARPREDVSPPPPPESAAPPKPRRNLLFSSSRKERERAGEPPAQEASASPHPAPSSPPVQPPAPAATFDDAWPQPDRGRSDALRRGRPSTSPESIAAATESAAPPAPAEEPPPVTVLKSGVVDGMAYSLYSDGSIEAQMPEGMMRFASIDELRSHLDHRP